MQSDKNLNRFTKAQEGIYDTALFELRNGHKQSHWMWFIFPQIDGLGKSYTAHYYAIKNKQEAQLYLNHPILGARLLECSKAVLKIKGRTVADIFGYPDDIKFKSSMTLFAAVASPDSVFEQALDMFYSGAKDGRTLELMHIKV